MLTIAAVDRRQQIIPDPLNALAFVGGLVAAGLRAEISPAGAALNALARAALMFSLFFAFRAGYRKMRGLEGMGLGDVKLAAVAGAWLDWSLLPLAIELAAIGALTVVLVGRLRGDRFDAKTRLPFGTYFGPALDMLAVGHVARQLRAAARIAYRADTVGRRRLVWNRRPTGCARLSFRELVERQFLSNRLANAYPVSSLLLAGVRRGQV